MTGLVATVNVLMGLAYLAIGVITAVEMKRDWALFGFSHFGAAVMAMAFTCGPHHLDHGAHLLIDHGRGGVHDLIAVVVGLPAGFIWVWLRIEAFGGGRGDRFIMGTPAWLKVLPTAAAVYVTALVSAVVQVTGNPFRVRSAIVAHVLLVVLYLAIAWFLLATQVAHRQEMGGWSASGLALGSIFWTCAVMHAVWVVYVGRGLYQHDWHGLVISWLAVPAGAYFLWVEQRVYRVARQRITGVGTATRARTRLRAP